MLGDGMRKSTIFGLLLLVFLINSAYAWQMSPSSVELSALPGETKSFDIVFSNTDNSSIPITISKGGYIAGWMTVTPYEFVLNPGDQANPTQRIVSVTINIPSTAEGDYNGQLIIDDNSSLKYFNITLHVSKWVFSKNITVDAFTKVVITNPNFQFEIHNIGESVELYVGTTKYDLYPDQHYETSDVKVTVLDRWDEQAKLMIQTTSTDSEITTEKLEEEQQQLEGGLEPLVTKWSFKVQEGTTKKMYVSVLNNYPYECELKDLIMIGDVIETSEGRKPLDFGEVSLGKLAAGEEFVYPVEVNTHDVELGTYTIRTQLIAICNGKREVAETVWEITVVSSVKPEAKSQELSISYPKSVKVGDEFKISVTNIPAGWNVYLIEQAGMNKTSVTRTEDKFEWVGKFDKEGTYTIPLWIFKDDGSVQIKNLQISVSKTSASSNQQKNSKLLIDIVPSPPKPNDEITVTVKDAKTLQPVEATIQVDVYEGDRKVNTFTYAGKFEVEADKRYCIIASAEGYDQEKVCFDVKPAIARLILPSTVYVGDEITIKYVDENNEPIEGAIIKINGEEYHDAVVNITVENEEYTIEAYAQGYEKKTASFKPKVKIEELNSTMPKYTGEALNITFNTDVSWKIMYGDEEVASGTGRVVSYVPQKAGIYDVYVNGQYYTSFAVEQKKYNMKMVALIVVIIGALAYYMKKPRTPKGRRAGYITHVPKGSVEVEK